jgi:hypothetical protein
MSQQNPNSGPPEEHGPPDHVEERTPDHVHVGKPPEEQRQDELESLRESVTWDNAPDWARCLHLEIQQLRDEQ